MPHDAIRFLRLRHLRGPNVWTYRPALEAVIDIGPLEDHPSHTLPGLYERLTAWLPGLIEHHCGVGERGGFLQRLREGTWAGHILEHIAIELLNLAGMPTGFGQTRSTDVRGVYKLVIRARQEEVARQALLDGRDLLMAAINDQPYDVAGAVKRLMALIDRHALGPSTAAIVDAASARRIPHIRLTEGNLVQLGYGSRQRRIWTAETDRTSAIAENISRDKDLTKRLLAECGVPVPEGRLVRDVEDAWEAAQEIGLPVVVKPVDANHARGVSLDVRSREELAAAFALAEREGSEVMVERYIRGREHRILVVGGRMVAASRGEHAVVVGDGQHTVRQLIERDINSDPRRGEEEEFPLDTIRLPENRDVMLELRRQGLQPDSVPEAGRVVLVQRTGLLTDDVTDEVHPDIAEWAALAARVVGLDVAGIDLVVEDITQPLIPQGGAIVEVNAGPGLLPHLKPARGTPRPVGEAIVAHLFGPNDQGRIPVVGITGTQGTAEIAALLGALLARTNRMVGISCAGQIWLNEQRIDASVPSDWEAGQRLLMNRLVDCAVIENSPRSILDEGLSYDRCLVGVVTDVPVPEGLDDHYVTTRDHMRKVVRTQVDVVLPEGCAVLNADCDVCAGLAELCDGDVLLYSTQGGHALRDAHIADGRRFLCDEGCHIVLYHGQTRHIIADLQHPGLQTLTTRVSLTSLLATVGAAVALDVPLDIIRACLESAPPLGISVH
ncbi:cyanophycin synthetase [Tepidimonas charontis]|uniref:Cyanophycin synthetase n=1 Tax=Tepidimonas charontis TaxID=2267262 RepID=A0A554XI71_9BURK|nr:cyanophycin synthetase [Tepidimonas charontis]TSE35530.1 Cyanophycin synthetase [Tepidimonas charontis]